MEIKINEKNDDENIISEEKIEMPDSNYDSSPYIEENNFPQENNKQNLESSLIENNLFPSEDNYQNNTNLEGQKIYEFMNSYSYKKNINSNKKKSNNTGTNHKQYVMTLYNSREEGRKLRYTCHLFEFVKKFEKLSNRVLGAYIPLGIYFLLSILEFISLIYIFRKYYFIPLSISIFLFIFYIFTLIIFFKFETTCCVISLFQLFMSLNFILYILLICFYLEDLEKKIMLLLITAAFIKLFIYIYLNCIIVVWVIEFKSKHASEKKK